MTNRFCAILLSLAALFPAPAAFSQNAIDNICGKEWWASSIYIEPFSDLYDYGQTCENKRCSSSLTFLKKGENDIYLDKKILVPSDVQNADMRFLYIEQLSNMASAQFFDAKTNEYRRFLLSPITSYYMNSPAHKRSSLLLEDYGTTSITENSVLAQYIRTPFQGKIAEDKYKRELELKLSEDSLEYAQKFKAGSGNAVFRLKYSPAKGESALPNSLAEKALYYLAARNFLGDKNLEIDDVFAPSFEARKDISEHISRVGDFFKALSDADWETKNGAAMRTFSKPYVYVFFVLDKRENLFFTDYVLEDEVQAFGIHSKDRFLSALPQNRKHLGHLEYMDMGMKDFTDLEIKPFLILFFNPSESRLYLCKYNEVKFSRGGKINLSSYSSFYFYDIPLGQKIPLNIEWKTDYSRFKERSIIKAPWHLKWEISDDFTEIKEYFKNGEDWVLQSVMKKVIDQDKNK